MWFLFLWFSDMQKNKDNCGKGILVAVICERSWKEKCFDVYNKKCILFECVDCFTV